MNWICCFCRSNFVSPEAILLSDYKDSFTVILDVALGNVEKFLCDIDRKNYLEIDRKNYFEFCVLHF